MTLLELFQLFVSSVVRFVKLFIHTSPSKVAFLVSIFTKGG